MTEVPAILLLFKDWAEENVCPEYTDAESGIADQNVENIAWLNINTNFASSNITLWDSGGYLCTVDTLTGNEPEYSGRGNVEENSDFCSIFEEFLDKVRHYNRA